MATKEKKRVPEYDDLVLQAVKFHNSFRVLEENNKEHMRPVKIENGFTYYSAPIGNDTAGAEIVCLCLAIELYLKALHSHKIGKYPESHDLKNLFFELPDTIRAMVFKRWSYNFDGTATAANFSDLMAQMKSSFIEWRYVFEAESALKFPYGHAVALCSSLNEVCGQIGSIRKHGVFGAA